MQLMFLSKDNVFFTGKAGSGESHVIFELMMTFKAKNSSVVVTFTNGISTVALNGINIHSFAGIGNSAAPGSSLFTGGEFK